MMIKENPPGYVHPAMYNVGEGQRWKPDEETHHLREQRPIDPTGQNKTQDNSTLQNWDVVKKWGNTI